MSDNTNNGDLDKLYGPAQTTEPSLAIGQENKGVLAVTDGVASIVAGVIENDGEIVTESAEDLDAKFIEKLEALDSELSEALIVYKEMMGEEFGNIEAAIIGIEYGPNPYMDSGANINNIEALAIFSLVSKYDFDKQVILFNGLLEKLKQAKNPMIQAMMLQYIESTRAGLFDKNSDFPKDSVEDKTFKEQLQRRYENYLEKIFYIYSQTNDIDLIHEILDYVLKKYLFSGKFDFPMEEFQEDINKTYNFQNYAAKIFSSFEELKGLRLSEIKGLPEGGITYVKGEFKIINEIRILRSDASYEDHPRLKKVKINFNVNIGFDGDYGEMTIYYLDYRKFNGKFI